MGQYYKFVNIDKKEICDRNRHGYKLMEHSYVSNVLTALKFFNGGVFNFSEIYQHINLRISWNGCLSTPCAKADTAFLHTYLRLPKKQ